MAIKNRRESLRKYYSSAENRAKVGRQMKERFKNEEYLNKMRHRYTCKPVLQYDKNGNFIAEYYSAKEAERQTGITRIDLCCRGGLKTAGGYKWKYK